MKSDTSVFGLYQNDEQIYRAMESLEQAGFRDEDLAILVSKTVGGKDLGHRKKNCACDGFFRGAVAGAFLGAAFGWGLTLVAPVDGSVQPLSGSDSVLVVFAGVGLLGSVGALIGYLMGLARVRYEAVRYQGKNPKGRLLLSVHADDGRWVQKAREVLVRTGARDIAEESEERPESPLEPVNELQTPLHAAS